MENAPLWRRILGEPVALGLVLLVFLRPWRDGLTFPSFNAYYIWIVMIIGALWFARMLVRGEAVRFPVPIALLGGFLGIAYVMGFGTYAYDPTHRNLHEWAMYLVLFVLATNALRNRLAVHIVLTGIVATWLVNGAWTVFHYFVMLRGMRQVLIDNPQVLLHYFGTSELTPELKNRLESNRAFGTFLFPNALGAFLILAIPFLATALRPAVGDFAEAQRAWVAERSSRKPAHGRWAFAVGLGVTVLVLTAFYFGNDLLGAARLQNEPPIPGTYRPFLVFLAPSALVGGVCGWILYRRGAGYLGRLLAAIAIPLAFVLCALSLWLSYSRGAMIALAGAAVLAALLTMGPRVPFFGRRWQAAAVVGLMLAGAGFMAPARAEDNVEFRLPDIHPTSVVHGDIRFQKHQQELKQLDVGGTERRVDDLTKLDSFKLRLTYWHVGMAMLTDNFLTGVGLGNFQTAYPKYQFLGAGDVEAAHNDYLQFFTETGVLGGAVFLAFWVYFGVWAARRILRQPAGRDRAFLIGIYAGTLAFAAHALVDFNFQNPGLATLAFLFAGLFFAMSAAYGEGEAAPAAPAIEGGNRSRAVAVAMALVVLITTGSTLHVFLYDLGLTEGSLGWRLYYVGDHKIFANRLHAGEEFVEKLRGQHIDPKRPKYPYMPLQLATLLIPDIAQLETVGALRVPTPERPGGTRALRPGEPIPRDAYLFISDPARAYQLGVKYAEYRIAELEKWDAMYPHDPEIASQIFKWYELLFNNAPDAIAKKRYAVEAEKWSRAAMDRSPEFPWWHITYAKGLWLRALMESGQTRMEYYYEGLEEYRKAKDLYPVSPFTTFQYGQALTKLGQALIDGGRRDEGQRMVQEGQKMLREANKLDRYKDLIA